LAWPTAATKGCRFLTLALGSWLLPSEETKTSNDPKLHPHYTFAFLKFLVDPKQNFGLLIASGNSQIQTWKAMGKLLIEAWVGPAANQMTPLNGSIMLVTAQRSLLIPGSQQFGNHWSHQKANNQ